ncbi:hypothetical protein [Phormidium sp. CCY1219]|nr:hypothetical protein [Phormidium sp. CCY1219]MEB3830928.1 hypothetical protein [Phormidium sp. CCY1219]
MNQLLHQVGGALSHRASPSARNLKIPPGDRASDRHPGTSQGFSPPSA